MPSRTSKPRIYELDLLENGLDFVRSGIEIFYSRKAPKPRAHKYAILHVFSGMLLLLKERLARIQPSLVFVDNTKAGTLGAKTTNYHQTFDRLAVHGIVIDQAKRDVLDRIQILRNAIEHYHVELSLTESREVIGEMVSFVHGFCINELDIFIEDKLPQKILDHFYELEGVRDNMSEFMAKDAAAEAEADERYFRQFEDQYAAMSPDEFLQHAATRHETATQDVPRHWCHACEQKTLVYLEVGACINPYCRATCQLATCQSCFETTIKYGYFNICDSCRWG